MKPNTPPPKKKKYSNKDSYLGTFCDFLENSKSKGVNNAIKVYGFYKYN